MSILSFTIFSIDKFLKRYAQLLISKSDFSFSVYMPNKYTVVLPLITYIRRFSKFRQCTKQFKLSCLKRLIKTNGGSIRKDCSPTPTSIVVESCGVY